MRILLVLFGLMLASVPAGAANVPGDACATLGQTKMSDDQKSLIGCLKNDSGGLVWKTMTSSNQSTCPSGKALMSFVNGVPSCGAVSSGASTPAPAPVLPALYYCPTQHPCTGGTSTTSTTCNGQTTQQSTCSVVCTYCAGMRNNVAYNCSNYPHNYSCTRVQ